MAAPDPSSRSKPLLAGQTGVGGVLLGQPGARRQLVLYEDPSCPFCRRFERRVGGMLPREIAAGAITVDYRIRCFLGPESVRASGALAAAAVAGAFDKLLGQLYANQPPEHSGGFTAEQLVALGERAGVTDRHFMESVRSGAYESFAEEREDRFAREDPDGTPGLWVDGVHVQGETLYDAAALEDLLRA